MLGEAPSRQLFLHRSCLILGAPSRLMGDRDQHRLEPEMRYVSDSVSVCFEPNTDVCRSGRQV